MDVVADEALVLGGLGIWEVFGFVLGSVGVLGGEDGAGVSEGKGGEEGATT